MKVVFNESKTRLLFQTQVPRELSILENFPGLNRQGGEYWIPNKLNVIQNIFERLRRKFPNASVSEEVYTRKHEVESLKELPPDFYFHTDPLHHQALALRHLITRESLGLLLDPGLGKTKIVLDYIFYLKQTLGSKFTKALIVCPCALLYVWAMEALKHRPELKVHVISEVNYAEKIKAREGKEAEIRRLKRRQEEENRGIMEADVVVVNYSKLVIADKFFLKCPWTFMAIDEGLVKNHVSQQTEVITALSKKIPYRTIMSGTLINNGPEDVFAPVRILEPAIFGTRMSRFREEYGVNIEAQGRKFTAGWKRRDEIRSGLEAVSLVMRKEDWLKLPEKKFFHVPVTLSEEQHRVYRELAANLYCKVSDTFEVEADSPLVCAAKLTQIGSGFIYPNFENGDEETSDLGLKVVGGVTERKERRKKATKVTRKRGEPYVFAEQPKIAKLMELLQGQLKGRKVVLWYNLGGELFLIQKALKDAGLSHLIVKGGISNTGEIITEFNTTDVQVLVCQAKAVNYGVTILGTDLDSTSIEFEPELDTRVYTHIFYSMNYSLEVFIQQQDRSHRIGQTMSPEYYILVADTEMEQAVIAALENKTEIREEFLVDITKRLRSPR